MLLLFGFLQNSFLLICKFVLNFRVYKRIAGLKVYIIFGKLYVRLFLKKFLRLWLNWLALEISCTYVLNVVHSRFPAILTRC